MSKTRFVLERKLTEMVPFKELKAGQRFWLDDKENVRLNRSHKSWNCCELSSGILFNIHPDTEVEIIAKI